MAKLNLKSAREIIAENLTEKHLLTHSLAVSAAMGAMAEHFGADAEYWKAVGYLHDVDFEKYPEEHLKHAEDILRGAGVDDEEAIKAVLSHGWGICSTVKPESNMEKSLYTVDELTGIISAAALMRPTGIKDMELKSVMKKFKDKKFAAKCDRELIKGGCEMLGMELGEVTDLCLKGMQSEAQALGICGSAE